MKLALDVWYEAWGRTGDGDAAASAKHGEAASQAEADVRDGTCRERRGVTGDLDPPPLCGA